MFPGLFLSVYAITAARPSAPVVPGRVVGDSVILHGDVSPGSCTSSEGQKEITGWIHTIQNLYAMSGAGFRV